MIKVFLVEDEVVMRNGIKNNIPWEQEGFEFVGEASDGELAYPLIKREKPDILITDIRMPFMDGLELSRLVKKELPQIKIIILSGYNEFDYAKTAIGIGVTDYLLKPISSAKLLEAVKKVADMIEKEQDNARLIERYEKEMEENTLQEKHKLWGSLVSNRLSTMELLEKGQRLGIDFTASAYLVFLFKLMEEGDATGCSEELNRASEKVNDLTGAWKNALSFDRSPEGWAFLIKGESEEEVHNTFEEVKKELLELTESYPNVEYFGGIGSVVHRIGDIQTSYKEAARAFSSRFFLDANQIADSSELLPRWTENDGKIDVSKMLSKKREHELVERFFKNGTVEEVDSFLDELFQGIGEQNCKSLLYRQYVVMDLFFCASDFLDNLEIPTENLPEECRDINQIVEKAGNAQSLRHQIGILFSETMILRDGHSKKKYSKLLEDAKAFIDENYRHDDMSLNMVAAQVNISPSYFSTIFSSEMGQTFVEYLTEKRMARAKELLRYSGKRSSEVAYEVGYRDPRYFSFLFKKTQGCTPSSYRAGEAERHEEP